jgi:hypothetical protein
MAELKVGDTLWCHDGRSHSRPWFEDTIKGETRVSWLLGHAGDIRVNKKTMLENMGAYGNRRWHTPESKANIDWLSKHRSKITSIVGSSDIDTLKAVAAIIKYDKAKP